MTTPETPACLWPDPNALGPMTDLYQLTMLAGYHETGMADHPATFELFVRRLPPNRSYMVFAGLEQALGDLARLAFSAEQIAWLAEHPAFWSIDGGFFDLLARLRFTGDVWSVPEGTVVFPGETLVRIEATLAQAQWIETFLIASLNYPTLVASKAARIVEQARGRALFEFGARRGHGPHAGLLAARAAYLAGFDGTSQVEAARLVGMPAVGTMAHAWVQAFPSEAEALAAFTRAFPQNSTLLVDTYDTIEGVRLAAAIEPAVSGVRLDSGDLATLSREARQILDAMDRPHTKIIASGDLDEHKIADLVAAEAPIDAFGVGTELVTSRDAPALSMVYKLVAIDGQGRVKRSPGKRTYPLGKQVWRRFGADGGMIGDHVTRHDEAAEGVPLLRQVMREGEVCDGLPGIEAIRRYTREQLAALPENLRGLSGGTDYPVTYSDALETAAGRLGL